jgi:hypothetical protein
MVNSQTTKGIQFLRRTKPIELPDELNDILEM